MPIEPMAPRPAPVPTPRADDGLAQARDARPTARPLPTPTPTADPAKAVLDGSEVSEAIDVLGKLVDAAGLYLDAAGKGIERAIDLNPAQVHITWDELGNIVKSELPSAKLDALREQFGDLKGIKRVLGPAGLVLGGLGIATADDPIHEATIAGGEALGGLVGLEAGAAAGALACAGTIAGLPAVPICAVGGGLIGGIAGSFGGGELAEAYYPELKELGNSALELAGEGLDAGGEFLEEAGELVGSAVDSAGDFLSDTLDFGW